MKGLWRQPSRTALTIIGIAIASATLFSLLSFDVGYKLALEKEFADSGIHLLVSTEGCPMEAASLVLHGGEIPTFLNESSMPDIVKIPGIRAATKMLIFSLPGEGGRIDLFYGIDDMMRLLKPHWKLQGTWFQDEHSIILGAEAAKVEKRAVGDKIYFPEIEAEFNVTGILERTGSEDDGFFFLPLKTAQLVFKKQGLLTGAGISVADPQQIGEVKSAIERIPGLQAVTAQQMMQQILKLVDSSKALMFAILGIALAVAVLGVLNTVLMSVMQKLPEYGYMRCVGASPRHIFLLVLIETLVLCLAGGMIGIGVGGLTSSLADAGIRHFLPYAPAGNMVVLDFNMALLTLGVIVAIGILAGFYPAWKAARVSPMEAIRNE